MAYKLYFEKLGRKGINVEIIVNEFTESEMNKCQKYLLSQHWEWIVDIDKLSGCIILPTCGFPFTIEKMGQKKKTLHLVLKSKWYDKIATGEKTSEYRECKSYWNKRFSGNKDLIDCFDDDYCRYNKVIFHRGYTAETMEFEVKNIFVTAQSNDLNLPYCWEIKLGDRIK